MTRRTRRARPSERRAWIEGDRPRALEKLARRAAKVTWSRRLFVLLLQELGVDETLTALVGDPKRIPHRRYAEAIAVALLIRHSWRADDLASLAMQLGLDGSGGERNCSTRNGRSLARKC